MTISPFGQKLVTRHVAKPWGCGRLPLPFINPGADKVGEIWFEGAGAGAGAGAGIGGGAGGGGGAAPLALMIKYLFTSEKLSIQVHPSDAQAHAMGLGGGKEECWLVLDAQPGATLGIGTREPLDAAQLRAAALDGSIEALMDWKPVQRGDFFYIPAGTVHAIGAGVSLVEIQQNADITYRLYDYGRPRELHLDDGVAVSKAVPYAHPLQKRIDFAEDRMLVDGPLFRVRLTGSARDTLPGSGPLIVVPLEGTVTAGTVTVSTGLPGDCDTSLTASAGECLALDADTPFEASDGARLLLARAC